MKSKKIQKKMTLKKQTIASLNVDEMRQQYGGTSPTEASMPIWCSMVETWCHTVCRPISGCDGWTCPLSC